MVLLLLADHLGVIRQYADGVTSISPTQTPYAASQVTPTLRPYLQAKCDPFAQSARLILPPSRHLATGHDSRITQDVFKDSAL
jgi:hypothetical protein